MTTNKNGIFGEEFSWYGFLYKCGKYLYVSAWVMAFVVCSIEGAFQFFGVPFMTVNRMSFAEALAWIILEATLFITFTVAIEHAIVGEEK